MSRPHKREYIQPGPQDCSLLRHQRSHRSEAIWYETIETSVLHCRRSGRALHHFEIDARLEPYLISSGFYGVARVGFFALDWHLITALVERWRPETHTFMMSEGECTITLQDVALITGLPIDGDGLVGCSRMNWLAVCENLLGRSPPAHAVRGSYVNMTWLTEEFKHVPANADAITLQRYARALILRLIGGSLFTDKSASRVCLMFLPLLEDFEKAGKYSWGGACLAYLYRELCRATEPTMSQISGALFLLQIWAWERFTVITPSLSNKAPHPNSPLGSRWSNARQTTEVTTHVLVHLRYQFDRMGPNDVVWEPYTDALIEALPEYCLRGRAIWRSVVPLICFHIVEWHQPDRVMRQFGMQQPIPHDPLQTDALHSMDLRRSDGDWITINSRWISLWDARAQSIVTGTPSSQPLHYHSQYMEWYRRVARRWISHSGAAIGAVADGIEDCRLRIRSNTEENIEIISRTLTAMLYALEEERRIAMMPQPQPIPIAPVDGEELDEAAVRQPESRPRRQRLRTAQRKVMSSPPTRHSEHGLFAPSPVEESSSNQTLDLNIVSRSMNPSLSVDSTPSLDST